MGDKYGEMSCLRTLNYTNLCISLFIIGLSSSLTWKGLMKIETCK